MGFLQNDTASVHVDFVLTDIGRQFLARNDGSFSVIKFFVSDDEVDYSIIQKFGRTVGMEKIEKNTPVFEALTNSSYALKYRCVSVSNPNLLRLPTFELTGEGVDTTNNLVSIGNTTVKRRSLTVAQTIQNENSIDVELRDQSFIVEMSNMFLQVLGAAPDNVDGQQRATYILTRDPGETALGGSRASFSIATKAITDAQFTIYGAANNKNLINTFVRVTGTHSGAVKEFQVQITKSS